MSELIILGNVLLEPPVNIRLLLHTVYLRMLCTSSDVAFSDAGREKWAGAGMHICRVFKSIVSVLVAQSFRNQRGCFYNTGKIQFIFQPENSCEDGGLLSSKSYTQLPCKRATVTKRHQSHSIMCLACHRPVFNNILGVYINCTTQWASWYFYILCIALGSQLPSVVLSYLLSLLPFISLKITFSPITFSIGDKACLSFQVAYFT